MDTRGQMSYTAIPSSPVGSFSRGSAALKGKGPSTHKGSKKFDSAVKQTPKLTYYFQKEVSHPQPVESPVTTKDASNPCEISSGGKAMQVCIYFTIHSFDSGEHDLCCSGVDSKSPHVLLELCQSHLFSSLILLKGTSLLAF